MSEPRVVQALESFSLNLRDGMPYTVRAGDLYDDTDRVVKANPKAFGPVELKSSAPSRAQDETADMSPGTRRALPTKGVAR